MDLSVKNIEITNSHPISFDLHVDDDRILIDIFDSGMLKKKLVLEISLGDLTLETIDNIKGTTSVNVLALRPIPAGPYGENHA